MSVPRISVVTPSFNQGRYIARTIDSILSQGYENLELIVIDGGSTDGSVEVIRKYEKYLHFWVTEKDGGQSHAINKGFEQATGDLLTWLNSDDWFYPNALNNFVRLFLEHSGAALVVGRGVIVDECGEVLHDKTPGKDITFDSICDWMSGGNFMQPSAMFSREVWRRTGKLSENLNIALDVDYWLRIAKLGYPMIGTTELLSGALSHPRAKTTALIDEMRLETARVIAQHGSLAGYDKALRVYADELRYERFKRDWFEKNFRAVIENPLMRLIQPVVKRMAREGSYWQKDLPSWSDRLRGRRE